MALLSLGVQEVWALTFHRRSVRTFFVIPAERHAASLKERSREFIRSPWGRRGHFSFRAHLPPDNAVIETPQGKARPQMPKPQNRRTTEPGYTNRNGQTVVRPTNLPGTDHGQRVYVLRCGSCLREYGANGSDIFSAVALGVRVANRGSRHAEPTRNQSKPRLAKQVVTQAGYREGVLRYFQHIGRVTRFGNRITVFAHGLQVRFDSFGHPRARLFERLSRGNAARKVRRIGAVPGGRWFVDHGVFIHFSPACFIMLLSVPGATSSEGWPCTVTLPGFVA
jgi:hypothetical protein